MCVCVCVISPPSTHTDRLTVVDACIKRVLAARKLSVKNTKLTEQDLFYREVRIYLSCIVTPSPWLHHVAMVTDIGEFS